MTYPGQQQYTRGSLKPLSVEDAADYIADVLKEQPAAVKGTECDLWMPTVCLRFVQERVGRQMSSSDNDQAVEEISSSFLDAAWQLSRLGVLRPAHYGDYGTLGNRNGEKMGYSITAFGRGWIAEHKSPAYIPTDPGRLQSLLLRRKDLFGAAFVLRVNDAALCYQAHAYYACCAMIGAAAESILLAAGIAKLGESAAQELYFGRSGRKQLTAAVLKGCTEATARDFRFHTDLISSWRDESAHADSTSIGETEAFTNMRGLIRFTHFAEERWQQLTSL
jgi:hypothetical protein